jgi:hypothetical protein
LGFAFVLKLETPLVQSKGSVYVAYLERRVELDIAFLEFSDPSMALQAMTLMNDSTDREMTPVRVQVGLFLY